MKNEQIIEHHYHHGDLLTAIVAALEKQKKSLHALSLDDLAAIDEFHLGGQTASQHFFAQLSFGFEVIVVNNRQDFALNLFVQTKQKNNLKNNAANSKNNDLPVLGLHTLMRSSSNEKRTNIENNTIAPIEIIARKC